MATLVDNAVRITRVFSEIKTAIESKGQTVSKSVESYADAINRIRVYEEPIIDYYLMPISKEPEECSVIIPVDDKDTQVIKTYNPITDGNYSVTTDFSSITIPIEEK